MNKPTKVFRAGGISATIWENQVKIGDIEKTVYKTVIDKSYKDKDGNWQKCGSFDENDLPKVKLVTKLSSF
jgi:hypothetical protein